MKSIRTINKNVEFLKKKKKRRKQYNREKEKKKSVLRASFKNYVATITAEQANK